MSEVALKYPQSALEGFQQGARLDLRMRLANEYLKTSPAVREFTRHALELTVGGARARVEGEADESQLPTIAQATAKFALELAGEVMKQAEELGWVAPIPDHSDLTAADKHQARRNGKFNTESQLAAQRYMQEVASGAIATAQGPRIAS